MRNKSIRSLILSLVIAASGSGFVLADGLPPLTHKLTAVKPIQVPELRLHNMDDQIVDIKDYSGKVVIVNFWATWCPPCRREMASLERLYQATKDHGVEVIAVNIGEDADIVFSFLGTIKPFPNFEFIIDPDASSMDAWKVRGLPTTYIVDPKGSIVYRAVGGREFDHPEIQKKVISLTR